jgi:hypothetical protein
VSDLHPTPVRKRLLRAIRDEPGRIYFEAGEVWDKVTAYRVTDKVRQFIAAGWVRALTPEEPRQKGESPLLTYYRVLDAGQKHIEEKKA